MENLKIGDVVYLKSGSNAMTVTLLDGENCHVVWHDKDDKDHNGYYPRESLTKENPKAIPPEAFKHS